MNLIRYAFAALLAALGQVTEAQNIFNKFEPATGILKGSSTTYVTQAAVSADIIGLWTGSCSASTFLRGDGACAVAGAPPAGSTNQLQYNGGSGSFAASADFAIDPTNGVLILSGPNGGVIGSVTATTTQIDGGDAINDTTGGAISIGSNGTSGPGGTITVSAGNAAGTGSGGSIAFNSGSPAGSLQNSGSISFSIPAGSGGGTAGAFGIYTNGSITPRFAMNGVGAITLAAGTTGGLPTLTMNLPTTTSIAIERSAPANGFAVDVFCADSSGALCSYVGTQGTTKFVSAASAGDFTIRADAGNVNFSLAGSGANDYQFSQTGMTIGAPTGGTKGAGTLNATGLYVNGAAVGSGSGTVTSVTCGTGLTGGTFTTTGTCALSVPVSVANGGTGTASPGEVAGTGISVSGSFPTKTISLSTPVSVANGGTGTASPGLVAGSNVTITGSWPNQTVNASSGGGSTGTFTGSLSGMTGTVTGTVSYSVAGNIACISLPSTIQGTSNSATLSMSGLPGAITPTSNNPNVAGGNLEDNGNGLAGSGSVSTSGVITFALAEVTGSRLEYTQSAFTSTGTKGIFGNWSMCYPLN